jgi:hypothetical protein
MVEEEDYQDCLRRGFRQRFNRPIAVANLNNAVKHLHAIAKSGPQHQVGVHTAVTKVTFTSTFAIRKAKSWK